MSSLLNNVQLDPAPVPMPARSFSKAGSSAWKPFFDNLTIGMSFTVDAKKDARIRAAYIGYNQRYNAPYSLSSRKIPNSDRIRFWAVEKRTKTA